jgi:GrpB-like predicted nucleotidyltransferase (UPF0157 family)
MHPPVTRTGAGWSNALEDCIDLVHPNSSWPDEYEREATSLAAALSHFDGLRLEHFGSTAVPNLRAKPIIDILLVHPTPALWPQLIEPITSVGYVYWAENPRKDRMFFVKGMPPYGSRRTHHVHVRLPQDAEAELAFRDLLRGDAALAREYEQLKESLARRYPTDRDAYTDGKSAFIAHALARRFI